MRLIDADELIETIRCSADLGGELGKVVQCVKYYAQLMVATAPTIEPKKGHWVSETKHHKDPEQDYYYIEDRCSECGARRKIGWGEANYCPNCGCELVYQEGEEP